MKEEILARQLAANKQNYEQLAQDLQESVDRLAEMEQDRAAEAQVRCTWWCSLVVVFCAGDSPVVDSPVLLLLLLLLPAVFSTLGRLATTFFRSDVDTGWQNDSR